jgi:hypothetical protein
MKPELSWQDVATRVVLIASGVIAAALLMLKGAPEAIPGLAIGGSLGAWLIRRTELRD